MFLEQHTVIAGKSLLAMLIFRILFLDTRISNLRLFLIEIYIGNGIELFPCKVLLLCVLVISIQSGFFRWPSSRTTARSTRDS